MVASVARQIVGNCRKCDLNLPFLQCHRDRERNGEIQRYRVTFREKYTDGKRNCSYSMFSAVALSVGALSL